MDHPKGVNRLQVLPQINLLTTHVVSSSGEFYSKCFVMSGILESMGEAHLSVCVCVCVCIPALFYTASRMGQTCPTIPTWPICKYLTRRSSLIDHLSATKNNRKQKAKIITKNVHCICPITHASSKV